MKKLKYVYVLLFVFVSLSLLTTKVKAFSGHGDGNDTIPYQITDCNQLQEMADDPSKDYELKGNIDCTATSSWNYDTELDSYYGFVPVGGGGNLFTGALNGNGYTISGLYVNKQGYFNGGLFGATSTGATVKDLNIDEATIIALGRAGVIAGVGTISLDNVHVTNSTVEGSDMDKEEIGGLIGYSYSSVVSNSSFSGSVSGKMRVGGLVGYEAEDLTISDSSNSGSVTGYIRVGGLVGSSENSVTISGSNNSGAVTSNGTYDTEYQGVGGLVGVAWKADITESYNTGTITTGNGGFYIGGILGGGGKTTISSSYNTGTITSGATSYNFNGIGGIVGSAINVTISDAYNRGDITENTDSDASINIGGVLGFAFVSSITNTYNTGILTQASGTGTMILGGIIGQIGFVSDFYNMATESSGKDIWGTLGKVFKLVSDFNVGDIFKLGESYAGGLIGYLDIWDGDSSQIEMNNNWWSNNIDQAIGYMGGISVFTNEQLVGKIDKEGILEGFKTYTHKVYNTNPSWDFNTIWSNVYNGKDYPILAFQYILPAQKPTASKKVGIYTSAVSVSLASVGSTKIMYTTDGSTPTCTVGTVYSSSISILKTTTIKAVGCDSGNVASDLGTFKYTISRASTVITPSSSTVDEETNKSTTDNTTPTNIVDNNQNNTGGNNEEDTKTSNRFNYNWLWLLLIPVTGIGVYTISRKK